MEHLSLIELLQREFTGYNGDKFRQDLLAGLTVAAVALPLALAFGVASGATAAAGLVTAILSGIIIGSLSGAPYQISGPTGAMSAILIVIANKYGIEGAWVTGVIAGLIIFVIGLLRLGRFIAFIPAPVITGFTSGIAIIIAVGQIDNFLGVKTAAADSSALKLLQYFQGGYTPNVPTVTIAVLVMITMIFWPSQWGKYLPGSLAGIIFATILSQITGWQIAIIGSIPRSIILEHRLLLTDIPWNDVSHLIAPAISIAALGAVESLLCGAVASKMTGIRLHANQELIAQGIGNVLIPFFGGVPATAAIARTSVGIKSGGQTRLVSIIHSVVLLASALLLAPIIGLIPLAALAGVLIITAYRMNEWHAIRFMFKNRFKSGITAFLATMIATITLDLTQAILIGVVISAAIFMNQVANMDITIREIDVEKMRQRGLDVKGTCEHMRVAYLSGPLFFAATGYFNETFSNLKTTNILILSMRAVPMMDLSGVEALGTLHEQFKKEGKILMLCALQPAVQRMLERSHLYEEFGGADNIFWSADRAILVAEQRSLCLTCQENDPVMNILRESAETF